MHFYAPTALRPASRLRIPPESQREIPAVLEPYHRNKVAIIAVYAGSMLLSIVIVTLSLQLWRADLRVPFNYTTDGQDSFFNMMLAKTVMETGWTSHNPLLGAPGTLDQLDFPNPESLHTAAIGLLSWCTHDFGVALNLYFLLTFPLTAFTTTLAARQIGLRPAVSIGVAQLVTFLPFHFMRGEMHLALAGYYALPLTIPAILALAGGERVVGIRKITAIVGFVLVGISSPYYAAFTLFFLSVAVLGRRDANALRAAAGLAVILIAAFVVQIIPNLLHTARFGPNPAAGQRVLYEGDLYGLHLTQMLLPVPGHRIAWLAAFRDQYAAHAPLVNENESSALGAIGAWGLLILLCQGLFGQRGGKLGALAMFTLAGVILATVGGIGPTLNYLGLTPIRGYNRISIFLGLFALMAVGLLIDGILARKRGSELKIALGLCVGALILGLLDQISPRFVPHYAEAAADFRCDADFVSSIEASVPAGALIFQLPVMSYPETPPINQLGDYQLFRGYLHSRTLHWSYGAMKGRAESAWQRQISSMPLAAMLAEIRSHGFAGIYLDRTGFSDDATERSLRSLLGLPGVSENGRLAFFKLDRPPA